MLCCVVLALSSLKVAVLSVGAMVIGLVRQPCLKYAEKKRLMKFSTSAELSDLHGPEQESVDSLPE